MSLLDITANDRINWIKSELKRLFGDALKDEDMVSDIGSGTVTVEDVEFCMAEGQLRIMGVCPKCTQDVPSYPVKRPADIADERANFRPMKHHCMDV